jgi:Tfp pilus assembly protein PilN
MKAVNLIPAEATTGNKGRSGLAVYALLGGLAILVVMSALYTLAGRSVQTKQHELAAVTAQADAAEKKAATLKTYVAFANMKKARVETVKNLVDSRFDWASALNEVARTVPSGTWIMSLEATTNPTVSVGGSDSGSIRGALPVPAIDLVGCAPGQKAVARTLTSLRRMSGVQRVTLGQSQKDDTGAAGANSGAADGVTQCGTRHQFSLTIFYQATSSSTAAAAATTTGGTTP